jgi:ribonuclease HI
MNCPKPHFLLFCDGNYPSNEQSTAAAAGGKNAVASNSRWRFVLEDIHSGTKFEANDREVGAAPDRTALVAVLRGLEALEQPSRVTLVTTSRYVFRGLQYGLTEWRENDYSWEHFGSVQPIRNADLWKRIDRTLAFHQVQCRLMSNEEDEKPTTAIDLAPTVQDQVEAIASAAAPVTTAAITADASLAESQLQPVCVVSRPNTVSIPSTSGTKHRVDSGAKNGGVANAGVPSDRLPTAIFKDTCSSMHVASVAHLPVDRPDDQTKILAFPTINNPNSRTNLQNVQAIYLDPQESAPDPKNTGWRIFRPIRWTVSLAKSGICWAWNVLLGIDEGIESYLRCLFLMDPTNRRRR